MWCNHLFISVFIVYFLKFSAFCCDETYKDTDRDLNFNAFDQTEGKGWRYEAKQKQYDCAAKRIKYYLDTHQKLENDQRRNLYFHLRQMCAMDQKNDQAISQFNFSLDPNEIKNASFLWNYYVMATIFFLKKDRLGLIKHKNKLE